jgi:hypothetical protein
VTQKTAVILVKFAVRFLLPVMVKVYVESVDTIAPPSVQFVKVNPELAVALTVTKVPEINDPPPDVVPPSGGFEESVNVFVTIVGRKFAISFRWPVIVNV